MGLDPFTNYTISVTACTANGCGNQTDVAIGTTEEEGMHIITISFYNKNHNI